MVNEMKIKYSIVILIVLIFVAQYVGAEFFSNVFDNATEDVIVEPDTEPVPSSDPELYVESVPPESKPRPPIMQPETLADCDKHMDIGIKNYCYLKMADKTGDSDICLKVTAPTSNNRREKCYVLAAARSGDSSICDNIVGEEEIKENCYRNVAEQS